MAERGYVYALYRENDIFYIGSAKNLKKRIATYKRGNCHNNKRLLSNVQKGFEVKVLFHGDNFRFEEVELIKKHKPRCNYSTIAYNNKNYGHFWSYVKQYQNRFGNSDFIKEIVEFYQSQSDFSKSKINNRFKTILTLKNKTMDCFV